MTKKDEFLANPDVSCRIEDEDGAILFNPDTDSTQVINPIGLDIWQVLEKEPKSLSDVILHIRNIYDDIPENDVEKDVEEFISNLQEKGFIGVVIHEQK